MESVKERGTKIISDRRNWNHSFRLVKLKREEKRWEGGNGVGFTACSKISPLHCVRMFEWKDLGEREIQTREIEKKIYDIFLVWKSVHKWEDK